MFPEAAGTSTLNVTAASLVTRLSPEASEVVKEASELARVLRIELYLVGGTVRDLILGIEPRDLDFLVNENISELALRLAKRLGGRLEEHREFLTADVRRMAGCPVDIASMRAEEYPDPGRLPVVRSATLSEDLARRDFSVNALALQLVPSDDPRLIDEWGGVRDIEHRVVRVLHDDSFREDPTRVIRGVRLSEELGFSFETRTRVLAMEAAARGFFDALTGDRLWHALSVLWDRPDRAAKAVRQLDDLGLLATFLPHPVETGSVVGALNDLSSAVQAAPCVNALLGSSAPWVVLALLTSGLSRDDRAEMASRLGLSGPRAEGLVRGSSALGTVSSLLAAKKVIPHRLDEALSRVSDVGLILSWLASDATGRRRIEWFLVEGREFKLQIRGADLVARGIEKGPAIGKALNETRQARLDGKLDASLELEYALAVARGRERALEGEKNDA